MKNNIVLFDIGPQLRNFNLKSLCKNNLNIKIMGKLNSKKVSNIFSKATYGIFITPDELIDKSGVMAAYSSHKICPINLFKIEDKKNIIQNNKFLKTFPDLNKKNLNVNKIIKKNYKLSKKNNLNKLIKTYSINFN